MLGLRRSRVGRLTLLAGAVLLGEVGAASAQPSWLRVGPPRTPEQYWRDEQEYRNRINQPDAGPPPPSSWTWPSLREALDQYGWFGHRAGRGNRIDPYPSP